MTSSSHPLTPTGANPAASARQLTLALSAAATLALALLATVVVLALQMHVEARDRSLLHRELEQARQILAGVDDAAALSAMPARLAAAFDKQAALAVRVQGPLGQPLYERLPHAAMPASLLARPALAQPAPLLNWQAADAHWRGSALVMRMPLDGSAPLTVAVALQVEQEEEFLQRLRWVLAGYVLLASAGFAALAWWACGRALGPGTGKL